MIHLDTHVVLWLYGGEIARIPPVARRAVEEDDVLISPMVSLELDYLHEIGRILLHGAPIVDDLAKRIGLRFSDTALLDIVRIASDLTWTRDPFDRLITAHAMADDSALVTADRTIREHFESTVWE